MFYYETTPVESKTFWIFVQCGRALSLHKEPPEVELVKKVNRKFVLVGGAVHATPT